MVEAVADRSRGKGPVTRVAVPAVSFGQHPGLIDHIQGVYPDAKINTEGLTVYRSEDETIEYLRGYEAAICSFEPITDRVLAALPDLRVISKLGVGLDKIDPDAMRRNGVRLGWTAGVNKRSVAELALCMALMSLRHVSSCNLAMRAGKRPLQRIGRQLSGRTVGIHGCGQIGKEFIRLLRPFGCRILVCDIKMYADFYAEHDVTTMPLVAMLEEAEVVSIHLPVTKETLWMYGGLELNSMRSDAVLINTARGRLIDEQALKERLMDGRIAAAAIDAAA